MSRFSDVWARSGPRKREARASPVIELAAPPLAGAFVALPEPRWRGGEGEAGAPQSRPLQIRRAVSMRLKVRSITSMAGGRSSTTAPLMPAATAPRTEAPSRRRGTRRRGSGECRAPNPYARVAPSVSARSSGAPSAPAASQRAGRGACRCRDPRSSGRALPAIGLRRRAARSFP